MKNRMRESRSFGSVRGEGGNVLAYSETFEYLVYCQVFEISAVHHRTTVPVTNAT